MHAPEIDFIGDIHGQLPALLALGRELGYDVADGWIHPERRLPVFLGDLPDRGRYSLGVSELVAALVRARRAVCLMGNHEYNLVAYHLGVSGYDEPKSSNKDTIAQLGQHRARWDAVLEFFRDLPIGLELPDIRAIHACWHKESLTAVQPVLGIDKKEPNGRDAASSVLAHVVLRSPFDGNRLRAGLPGDTADKTADIPHENLIKGFELDVPVPFIDNDGKERRRKRAVWWSEDASHVLWDKTQVFGHYWNVPPERGEFAPPFPSGHPKLRSWAADAAERCAPRGRVPLTERYACVDFNGITLASPKRACVGALRWPEREIAWATAPKEASPADLECVRALSG